MGDDIANKDIHSLLVVELKKYLQTRGLPISGKKADLIARLEEALEKEKIIQQSKEENTNDEKEKEKISDEAEVDVLEEEKKEEDQLTGKNEGQEFLTEEEKRTKRAERFNIASVTSDSEKKQQRAQRFALSNQTSNSTKGPLSQEMQLVRAQRFGIPIKTAKQQSTNQSDPDLLKKRKERFSSATGLLTSSKNLTWSSSDEEKKRKRAIKFSLNQQDKRQRL